MKHSDLKRVEFMPQDLTDKAWIWYRSEYWGSERYYRHYDPITDQTSYYWWDRCGEPELIGHSIESVVNDMESHYETLIEGDFSALVTISDAHAYSIHVLNHGGNAEKQYQIVASLCNRSQIRKFEKDFDALTEMIISGEMVIPDGETMEYDELREILE